MLAMRANVIVGYIERGLAVPEQDMDRLITAILRGN